MGKAEKGCRVNDQEEQGSGEFKHSPERMEAWGVELTEEDVDILLHNAKLNIINRKGKNEFTKEEAEQIVKRLDAIREWAEETGARAALMSMAVMGVAVLDADPKTGEITASMSPDVTVHTDAAEKPRDGDACPECSGCVRHTETDDGTVLQCDHCGTVFE